MPAQQHSSTAAQQDSRTATKQDSRTSEAQLGAGNTANQHVVHRQQAGCICTAHAAFHACWQARVGKNCRTLSWPPCANACATWAPPHRHSCIWPSSACYQRCQASASLHTCHPEVGAVVAKEVWVIVDLHATQPSAAAMCVLVVPQQPH